MQYLVSAIQATTEQANAGLSQDILDQLAAGNVPANFTLDLFGDSLQSGVANNFDSQGQPCVPGAFNTDCVIQVTVNLQSDPVVAGRFALAYSIVNTDTNSSSIESVNADVPIPSQAINAGGAQIKCPNGFLMGLQSNPAQVQCINFDSSVQCGPGQIAKGLILNTPPGNGADTSITVDCQNMRNISCTSPEQVLVSVNPYYFDPFTTVPTGANAINMGACEVPIKGQDSGGNDRADTFVAPIAYSANPPKYPNDIQACPELSGGTKIYTFNDAVTPATCTLNSSYQRSPAGVTP